MARAPAQGHSITSKLHLDFMFDFVLQSWVVVEKVTQKNILLMKWHLRSQLDREACHSLTYSELQQLYAG